SALTENIDVIVCVVDATNLVRNLYLATQLIETGKPVVIALTMMDIAERNGLRIDVGRLAEGLGVPVMPVVAKQRRGLKELGEEILQVSLRLFSPNSKPNFATANPRERQSALIRRYAFIERVVSDSVDVSSPNKFHSERID